MQQIDFFSLNRGIQERFVEAARAQGAPLPVLVARPPAPLGVLAWVGAALGVFVVWVVFLSAGYGDLESPFAIARPWTIGVHAVLLGLVIWLSLRARKVWQKRLSLPFVPTVYLFPIGVIDARAPRFVLHPLSELTDAKTTSSGVRLHFGSTSFEFAVPPERRAEALGLIEKQRSHLLALPPDSRDKELVLLDPLRDNGFKNPFSPPDSMRPPAPRGVYKEPLIALSVGLVLGVGAFSVRNVFSEAKLYTDARVADTAQAYRSYLERGGQREDVADVLLPRAELRDAQQRGGVEAIEEYIASHPNSKISHEVQAALKGALLAALEEAKKQNTLAALSEFEARYGKHGLVDAEVEKARREHLARILENFRKQSNGDPELVAFAQKLIERGAKEGPRVVVAFRRRLPSTLIDSQKVLVKSSYFAGDATLPAKYFDAASSAVREERYGREIVERLQSLFPTEIARFELGPTSEDASEELPKVDVPTLLFTYRHELSGAYMSRKPRAAFAGVGLFVRVNFILPSDSQDLSFKYTGWLAPDVKRIEAGELELTGVYDDMVDKAFRKFLKKYWGTWFPE
jgi:hypothetical protein